VAQINAITFEADSEDVASKRHFYLKTESGVTYYSLEDLVGITFEPAIEDSGDWDGDGLLNDDELKKYFTDPMKVDTDGDGWDDNEEIAQFDPEADPYRFNPLIADLPRLRVSMRTYPEIELLYTTSEGESKSRSVSEGESISQSASMSNSHTRSFSVGTSVSMTVGGKVGGKIAEKPELTLEASASLTAGFSLGMSQSASVSQSRSHSVGRSFSQAESEAQSSSISYRGAKISYDVRLENPSNISYTIRSLVLTTYMLDHSRYGAPTALAQMTLDGQFKGFSPITLNPGETSGDVELVYEGLSIAQGRDLGTRARTMWCGISGYEITYTDKNGKSRNFNYAGTSVPARTAYILVDWGPGKNHPPVEANVAVLNRFNRFSSGLTDRYLPVSLNDILSYMSLPYETGTHNGVSGIVSVDGIDHEPEQNGYWFVVRAARNGDLTIRGLTTGSYSPSDMRLRAGDGLEIIYSKDQDQDGIPLRVEVGLGCSDTDVDSDGDGLLDIEEINGWVTLKGDTVRTEPTNVDTDGDGTPDPSDEEPLTRKQNTSAALSALALMGIDGTVETYSFDDSSVRSVDLTATILTEDALLKFTTTERVKAVVVDGDTAKPLNDWQPVYSLTMVGLLPDTSSLAVKVISEDMTESATYNLKILSKLSDLKVAVNPMPGATHKAFSFAGSYNTADSRVKGVILFRSTAKANLTPISLVARNDNFTPHVDPHVAQVVTFDPGQDAAFSDTVSKFMPDADYQYRICTWTEIGGRYYYSPGNAYAAARTVGTWKVSLSDFTFTVLKDCEGPLPASCFYFSGENCCDVSSHYGNESIGDFGWMLGIAFASGGSAGNWMDPEPGVSVANGIQVQDGGTIQAAKVGTFPTTPSSYATTAGSFGISAQLTEKDCGTAGAQVLKFSETVISFDKVWAKVPVALAGSYSVNDIMYTIEPLHQHAWNPDVCDARLQFKIDLTIESN
jgi:hypothetical protein